MAPARRSTLRARSTDAHGCLLLPLMTPQRHDYEAGDYLMTPMMLVIAPITPPEIASFADDSGRGWNPILTFGRGLSVV